MYIKRHRLRNFQPTHDHERKRVAQWISFVVCRHNISRAALWSCIGQTSSMSRVDYGRKVPRRSVPGVSCSGKGGVNFAKTGSVVTKCVRRRNNSARCLGPSTVSFSFVAIGDPKGRIKKDPASSSSFAFLPAPFFYLAIVSISRWRVFKIIIRQRRGIDPFAFHLIHFLGTPYR